MNQLRSSARLLCVSTLFLLAACVPGASTVAFDQSRINPNHVFYSIEASCYAGADVTYANSNGDTTQRAGQGNGWAYGWVPHPGQGFYLSAQSNCVRGPITARLIRDGQVLRENTSHGRYAVVTISGRM